MHGIVGPDDSVSQIESNTLRNASQARSVGTGTEILRKGLREFTPGPDDKIDDDVIQAKYDPNAGRKKQHVLVGYLNNYIARIVSEKNQLYAFRMYPRQAWSFRSLDALREDLKPYLICEKDTGKGTNPYEPWSMNEHRKTFDYIGFNPSCQYPYDYLDDEGKMVINKFRGFKAKELDNETPVDYELINPILEHIALLWCDGRNDLSEYVLSWLAWLVQKSRKPGTFLLILGDQGTGKGSIASFMREKVIGPGLSRPLQGRDVFSQLLGRFNTDEGVVLSVLDELPRLDPKLSDKWKALVTEHWISQERKGKDATQIQDFQSFIVLSNNGCPVPITEDDRRTVAMKVSDERKKDFEHWQWFHDVYLARPEVADHWLTFLRRRDLSKYNPAKIVDTPERQELMMQMSDERVEDSGKICHLIREEMLERTGESSTGVTTDRFWVLFEKKWVQSLGESQPKPGKTSAIKQMDMVLCGKQLESSGRRFGKPQQYGWKGWRERSS